MCLNPKWIYKKGNYKENNYRGKKGDFYELGTYSKCGHCQQCINEKCNNWVVRNYYEEKRHQKKCFITLTYRDNPVILVKKDFQDFAKRLRYYLKEKIRIFYVGEYGTLRGRPHYHAIIYGWEDECAIYKTINKKQNIIYTSNIIEKAWGKGITSYQKFDTHEIPYITLYETAKESHKKAYLIKKEKVQDFKNKLLSFNMNQETRKNLIAELNAKIEEMEREKAKYLAIKEFNGWSLAMGWEPFFEEFKKNPSRYVWTEYIEDKAFITPTPWVKKLANMGYEEAKKEMFKRENENIIRSEQDERNTNQLKLQLKELNKVIEWNDKKNGAVF